MSKILIANWKSNPQTEAEAVALAEASDVAGWILCPPFVFLNQVAKTIKKAQLGAQDVFWNKGAFTGEVSPEQLNSLGVKYVIIGHSERRQNLGETDEMVAKKVAAALQAGITPVICVGESKSARDAGQTQTFIKQQLEVGLSLSGECEKEIIVAYEPMWAISTSREHTHDNPQDTITVISFLKRRNRSLFMADR